MTVEGQKVTRDAYNDPDIVIGYVESNSRNPKLHRQLKDFALTIPGKTVIDIGCGPGHDAYKFFELGFRVVGVDYSLPMIRMARSLQDTDNKPAFVVGDMRQVGGLFPQDTFDAAWISASLLHIPQEDVPQVLQGVRRIVKNGGKVYIGLKGGGQSVETVFENKYGKPMAREFIFWDEDGFVNLAQENGFVVDRIEDSKGGTTRGSPTSWLNFYLQVEKDM